MDLPLEVRRDAARYVAIFNDYMDFKIRPWDKHGMDKGVLFPVRKNALRLLKQEIVVQKQAEWDEAHGNKQPDEIIQEQQQDQQQQQQLQFAERRSARSEHNRTRYSSAGEKYTEVIQNTAEFPVPTDNDVLNWNEDSWMKFAAPLELEAYFNEHPEKKPQGWVNPSETLQKEEEDDVKDESSTSSS